MDAILSSLQERSLLAWLALATIGAGIYLVSLAVYRLYLSPLAHIPGPKLAALTQWYETYWELFVTPQGQFTMHLQALHEQYGPIIRINPNEVHIKDSSFFHVLYNNQPAWDKPSALQHRFGFELGTFSTPGHRLHRHRRAALNPFFSKRNVSHFAPVTQAQMYRLCDRLAREFQGTDKVIRLDWMFACFVADAVVSFCLEEVTYDWLAAPDFRCDFADAARVLLDTTHLVTQFPLVATLINNLPKSWLIRMSPHMRVMIEFHAEMLRQVKSMIASSSSSISSEKGTHSDDTAATTTTTNSKTHKTVLRALRESDLPAEEVSEKRVYHEAVQIISAGVETVQTALTIASFHIFDSPRIWTRLRAELELAIPDPDNVPSLETLEQLPYLSACIQEACRLAYGTAQRNHRSSEHITLEYGGYKVPPGAIVSMDIYSITHDESIYPDSHAYLPERWLDNPRAPDGKPLSTYMVSFSRGSRQCLGMHLARSEMYIVMANLYRRFSFELFETDRSHVDYCYDAFVPRPKPGTQGVRVYVK